MTLIHLPNALRVEDLTRRELIASALAGALVLACGSDEDEESSAGSTSGLFPVTINHKLGSTIVPEQPRRIVTIGFNEQDFLLALGIQPVGVRYWFGEHPYATGPWAQEALAGATPTVLKGSEVDFELVASLNPDLIIGIYYAMKEENYARFTQIAPTLPQSGEHVNYTVPWEEELRLIAKAVGKEPQAETIIKDVEQKFAAAIDAHPEWKGLRYAVGTDRGDGNFAIYSPKDARSQIVNNLGLTISEAVAAEITEGFVKNLSWELSQLLETDVLFWRDSPESMKDNQIFQNLNVVREGRVVYIDESPLSDAISYNSPLSLPFVIQEISPLIEAAVKNL